MKSLKPRAAAQQAAPSLPAPRLSAVEALRITAVQAPGLPPAQVAASDRPTTLNLRLRSSTVLALGERARAEGLTQKQVVCRALAQAGIAVAPADLEDRTPRRRG